MVKQITKGKVNEEFRVADFGCGTGLIGKYLAE
jgi:16S rRNA G1207 methylase RsmC